MDWLSLILGIIKIVSQITTYLNNRALLNAGGVAAVQAALRGQADDLQRLIGVEDAAGERFDDDARNGKLPDDFQSRD